MTDWIFMLAIATFVLVLAFVVWTKMSAAKHHRSGSGDGIGSASDPLAGSTNRVRDPDTLRTSLDNAAAANPPRA